MVVARVLPIFLWVGDPGRLRGSRKRLPHLGGLRFRREFQRLGRAIGLGLLE
jgi:hypothetical protein